MNWSAARPSRVPKSGSETYSIAGATTRLSFNRSSRYLFCCKEVSPVSQSLSALGAAGLAALDYLDRGEPAPAAWVAAQLALVQQAKKAQAQLLIMVAPSVEKLVQASAGQPAPSSAPTK